jgi:hypothetical protein
MMHLNQSKDTIRVHTLQGAVLKLSQRGAGGADINYTLTAIDVKKQACLDTPLCPDDVLLLSGGSAVADDEAICSQREGLYLLLRSTAVASCRIALKVTKNGESTTAHLEVPANMRIVLLKKELFKALSNNKPNQLAIPVGAQRMVCRGQILHDHSCLGDFLFTDRMRYSKKTSKSGTTAAAAAAAAGPDLTVFVTASADLSKEVPVHLKMLNGQSFKEYLSVSTPLIFLRQILWRQHALPLELPLYFYLTDKESGARMLLDTAKTLYDYEICSAVTLSLYPYIILGDPVTPPTTPRPCPWTGAGAGSPVSATAPLSPVHALSIGISNSAGGNTIIPKRRSTAKCGPAKSPKSGAAPAAVSKPANTGLFGLKKGFLGGSDSASKKTKNNEC